MLRILSLCFILCLSPLLAHAKDWVMMHSTEAAPEHHLKTMFMIQPQYAYTEGTNISAGPFIGEEGVFNLNAPEFRDSSSFQIVRALAMARGNVPGTDGKINYLGMVDAGENLITGSERSTLSPTNLQLTDASVTFNYIPFARLRIGQFITPSSNEMLKPVQVFDFANFTNFSIFAMLDWQMKAPGDATIDNRPSHPNAGFRDIGLMVFDTFATGAFQHTYALMLGNGNGIVQWEDDGHEDFYWRYRLGFQMAEGNSFEFVQWGVVGNRDLVVGGTWNTFQRQRYGVDIAANWGPSRLELGYGYADGVIFHGTLGAGQPGVINGSAQVASFLTLPGENARGYQIAYMYDLDKQKSFGVRYDQMEYGLRVAANQRKFSTWALSAQYKFTEDSPTRLMLNYEFRDAEAPKLAAAAAINQFLGGVDDRVSLNLFWFF